jgi:hypothetical protein
VTELLNRPGQLYVQIDGSQVYHEVKNLTGKLLRAGSTLCGLSFAMHETTEQPTRRVCKACEKQKQKRVER